VEYGRFAYLTHPLQKKPSGDKKDQLKIITNLLKQADSIVHAGDPMTKGSYWLMKS